MGTEKRRMMKAFSTYHFQNGKIAELDRQFPSYLSAWSSGLSLNENDTHYLYCMQTFTEEDGYAYVEFWDNNKNFHSYSLNAGMYACIPGSAYVHGGKGIVVSRENYNGVFSLGGPAEREGRLKYIDGCTDSLLVAPIKLGDPCLNLLYFPPGIDQTRHTHPSDRIGLVMSGNGRCHYWENGLEEVVQLVPDTIFCIHTDGLHKFSTPYEEEMRVLAYHPDSDYGPTDQFHPMLNRTIVDGISANSLPEIQTK
jgi:quercetin dioxygenase-like cupin family protein